MSQEYKVRGNYSCKNLYTFIVRHNSFVWKAKNMGVIGTKKKIFISRESIITSGHAYMENFQTLTEFFFLDICK